MILIVSEQEDHSTSEVIQWLIYYKARFVRVNKGDRLALRNVQISNHKDCKFVLLSKERMKIFHVHSGLKDYPFISFERAVVILANRLFLIFKDCYSYGLLQSR